MAAYTEQRQVDCENGSISYYLTRKSVKNINIRIKPDGRVLVSANSNVPTAFIDGMIRQKQNVIQSALARYAENEKNAQISNTPRRYIDGENYVLLGKSLRLKVEESKNEVVYTDGVYIVLKVRDKNNFRHKEIMMTKWLKEYQIKIFREIMQETYASFQKYGVPFPELKIRTMTTRWGSCRPQKGSITLNSRLIKAPRTCIEYVVLHEFVHFIHPNHSRQFWNFVTRMMPDWRERKAELERV